MYSLKLDKLLWDQRWEMKSETVGEVDKARRSFIEDALQFLANFRDGVAFLSEEESCRKKLAEIKQFMESLEDSLPEEQPTGQGRCAGGFWTDWQDMEYNQLEMKKHMFMFQLYDVYQEHKATWSKMPACDGELRKLELQLERVLLLYNIRRCEMSLFATRKDYFDMVCCVATYVAESIYFMKRLLSCLEEGTKPSSWYCNDEILIPKELKLASASDLSCSDDEDL